MFEDISTFDAENPIVGSLLREIDLNKKQTESDFIKSLPSQPGKELEIQKRLDRLRDIKRFNKNNNNNNKIIITKMMVVEGGGGIYFQQAPQHLQKTIMPLSLRFQT